MNRMRLMSFALATMALSASADNTVLLSDYDDAPRRKNKPQGVRIDDPHQVPAEKSKSLQRMLKRKGRK